MFGRFVGTHKEDSVPDTVNNPYTQFTGLIHLAISVGSEDKVDQLTSEMQQAGHQIIDGHP